METKIFFQWQPRQNFLLICSCYLTPQISFCTGGSLSEVLESNRRTGTRMSESDFKQVLLQVAQGLKLIHSQNLVHLDIKPGQSLVNSLSSSIFKNSCLLSESKICIHHLVNRSVKVNISGLRSSGVRALYARYPSFEFQLRLELSPPV